MSGELKWNYLNEDEIDKLNKTLDKDNRAISEKLLMEFSDKEKGRFYEFNKFARENKNELAVCFRGNSAPECITIYYNNHMFWQLSLVDNKCKVEINFDHARYYKTEKENYKDLMQEFGELGFDIKGKEIKKKDSVGILYCVKNERFCEKFIKDSYNILMRIMDTFFDLNNKQDQFKFFAGIGQTNRKYSYIEKRWQQRLFRYYKNTNNGLFVYDLEFSQKFPSKKIRDKMHKIVNEPDMLAIRFNKNSEPEAMVLIEVKSTKEACTNDSSGVKKHLVGMKNYSADERFMANRRREAKEILRQYRDTGLYEALDSINLEECNFEKLEVERLLILTDNVLPGKMKSNNSAIDYYLSTRSRKKIDINKIAHDNKCDICLIKGPYFERDDNKIGTRTIRTN